MSSVSRDWLPLDIAGHASIRALLTTAVEAWSEHWFSRRRLAVGAIDGVACGGAGRDHGRSWRRYAGSLAINRPVGDALSLAAWLLDADFDPLLASAADRLILEELETALLTDLCQRLEAALGLPQSVPAKADEALDPLGRDGGAIVDLKEAGGALALRIAVPLAALAATRKSNMSARRVSSQPIQSRLAALSQTKVEAEAHLGGVELSLEDLQNLAPGDVLVLNTKLDGLALLAVEGAVRPLAHGRISKTEGQLSLTLEA